MTDSDRYLLVFSLSIFFGLLALGLITMKSSNNIETAFDNIDQQLKIITMANMQKNNAVQCYGADEYDEFLSKKRQEANYMQFLTAKTAEGSDLEIHLNASPRKNGLFYIVKMQKNNEGDSLHCIIMQGTDMKMALKQAGDESAAEKAIEDVVDAVEETRSKAAEAVKETLEEGRQAIEDSGEAIDEMAEEAKPAETGVDEYDAAPEDQQAEE